MRDYTREQVLRNEARYIKKEHSDGIHLMGPPKIAFEEVKAKENTQKDL